MKRILSLILVFLVTSVLVVQPVHAQARTKATPTPSASPAVTQAQLDAAAASTAAAIASESAVEATPSAAVEQKIQEKKDKDITDTTGQQKNKLEALLDENPPGPLSWNNFIQYGIRYAVRNGVSVNTIVLVLLFPMIASLIAGSRHVIGLRGFGIYIPAVLSVALVSTGIPAGMIIFIAIVSAALFANKFIKQVKISYLPRTALLLWTISLGLLGMFILAPLVNLVTVLSVNIFPILILVLLSENFLDAQARSKQTEAIAITVETIVLAAICGLILKWEPMQRVALLDPEILLFTTAVANILIGKFTGLRLTERLRFRNIIEE